MNSGRPIPELAALYEVVPFMTYPGWERDVERAEADWVRGCHTAEYFTWTVEKMRRKQRLHDSNDGGA